MKKPRLVILRGKPTSGKSTAYANLRKSKFMKDWLFVDHCAFKTELGKDEGKKKLFSELRKVMLSEKNIIIEEMSMKLLYFNLQLILRQLTREMLKGLRINGILLWEKNGLTNFIKCMMKDLTKKLF